MYLNFWINKVTWTGKWLVYFFCNTSSTVNDVCMHESGTSRNGIFPFALGWGFHFLSAFLLLVIHTLTQYRKTTHTCTQVFLVSAGSMLVTSLSSRSMIADVLRWYRTRSRNCSRDFRKSKTCKLAKIWENGSTTSQLHHFSSKVGQTVGWMCPNNSLQTVTSEEHIFMVVHLDPI